MQGATSECNGFPSTKGHKEYSEHYKLMHDLHWIRCHGHQYTTDIGSSPIYVLTSTLPTSNPFLILRLQSLSGRFSFTDYGTYILVHTLLLRHSQCHGDYFTWTLKKREQFVIRFT